jgi:hypothetical protein
MVGIDRTADPPTAVFHLRWPSSDRNGARTARPTVNDDDDPSSFRKRKSELTEPVCHPPPPLDEEMENDNEEEEQEAKSDRISDETSPTSAADEEADRAIDRRTAAVALTVAGHLPIEDATLLIVDYERLYIPPLLQQIGRWYSRLHYRLSRNQTEAVAVCIGWKTDGDTSSHATVRSQIVAVRPTTDSAVFVVRMSKGEQHDFVPMRSQTEVVFMPVVPIFGKHEITNLSLFSVSNARQAVYETSKKDVHRLLVEAEAAADAAAGRCSCCHEPMDGSGNRRRRRHRH